MIQTLFGSVPQEPTFFEKLQQGIRKTREGLAGKLEDLFAGKKVIDADLLDELEYVLIGADIGVRTTGEILESVKQKLDRKQLKEIDELRTVIRVHLLEVLRRPWTTSGSSCTSTTGATARTARGSRRATASRGGTASMGWLRARA